MAFPADLPAHTRPYNYTQVADLATAFGVSSVLNPTDVETERDYLIAQIQDPANWTDPSDALDQFCGRCSGTGEYLRSVETGDASHTENVRCKVCDGWGYTKDLEAPATVYYEPRFDANGIAL